MHGWYPLVSEDANTSREAAEYSQPANVTGVGGEKDGVFLGHKFSSLQTVMCPLQFSSTNKMSRQTL